MKDFSRFGVLFSFFVVAFLLAACGGALPQAEVPAKGPKVEANVVAFTGNVEAVRGREWTISGQTLTVDSQALLDPNIGVGDRVSVEASVSADRVVAIKVAPSPARMTVFDVLSETVRKPDRVEAPPPNLRSVPEASNSSDAFIPQTGASATEIFGMVEEIAEAAITVDGVTYELTSVTEINDALAVGDLVKLHVTINADGMVTVREIEKFSASSDANSGHPGGNDDPPNHHANNKNVHGHSSSRDGFHHDRNDNHGIRSGKSGSGSD